MSIEFYALADAREYLTKIGHESIALYGHDLTVQAFFDLHHPGGWQAWYDRTFDLTVA